jgi:hypothetical protein
MRPLVLIIALALAGTGCGRFFAAIPRYTEIERPVIAEEVVGHWVLTTNSVTSAMIGGFAPTNGEAVVIWVRSDGTYSSHMISRGWNGSRTTAQREDQDGKWSLDFTPSGLSKNALVFRTASDAVSSISIARDSQSMVLWRSWGDPDEGVDLVFRKTGGT